MNKVNIGFWIKFRKLEKAFNKLKQRKQRIANLHKYYNTREDDIQLYNGYAALACEAKYRGMEGEETKAVSEAGAMKWQRNTTIKTTAEKIADTTFKSTSQKYI